MGSQYYIDYSKPNCSNNDTKQCPINYLSPCMVLEKYSEKYNIINIVQYMQITIITITHLHHVKTIAKCRHKLVMKWKILKYFNYYS
jgi:hypothetical protein